MRVTAAFVVTILLLAGCSKAPEKEEGPERVEVEPGLTLLQGTGGLRGIVYRDEGTPAQDVRISVIGTTNFTTTGTSGRFLFTDIAPGPYTIDARSTGFLPQAVEVTIKADAITNVSFTMVPDLSKSGAQRAHIHDIWGGAASLDLVDRALDMSRAAEPGEPGPYDAVFARVTRPTNGNIWGPISLDEFDDGRGAIVPPGTGHIELSLSWTQQDHTSETLGMLVFTPDRTEFELDPQASPATWTVPVTQNDTDNGHAPWSAWRFYIVNDDDPAIIINGQIQAKITAFKGTDPPVEPPHIDFWGEATSMEILIDNPRVVATGDSWNRYSGAFRLDEDALVPPGTKELHLEFTYTLNEAQQPTRPDGYYLTWRSADMNPYSHLRDYWTVEPVAVSGTTLTYVIPIESHQTDQFYDQRSNWRFVPTMPGEEESLWDRGVPSGRTFELSAMAYR